MSDKTFVNTRTLICAYDLDTGAKRTVAAVGDDVDRASRRHWYRADRKGGDPTRIWRNASLRKDLRRPCAPSRAIHARPLEPRTSDRLQRRHGSLERSDVDICANLQLAPPSISISIVSAGFDATSEGRRWRQRHHERHECTRQRGATVEKALMITAHSSVGAGGPWRCYKRRENVRTSFQLEASFVLFC